MLCLPKLSTKVGLLIVVFVCVVVTLMLNRAMSSYQQKSVIVTSLETTTSAHVLSEKLLEKIYNMSVISDSIIRDVQKRSDDRGRLLLDVFAAVFQESRNVSRLLTVVQNLSDKLLHGPNSTDSIASETRSEWENSIGTANELKTQHRYIQKSIHNDELSKEIQSNAFQQNGHPELFRKLSTRSNYNRSDLISEPIDYRAHLGNVIHSPLARKEDEQKLHDVVSGVYPRVVKYILPYNGKVGQRPVFITAFDKSHYNEGKGIVKMFHEKMHPLNYTFVFYDMGLTIQQASTVRNNLLSQYGTNQANLNTNYTKKTMYSIYCVVME